MTHRAFGGGVSRVAIVAVAVLVVGFSVAPASARSGGGRREPEHRRECRGRDDDRSRPPHLMCPGKQEVARIEEKGCPVTPKRPVHIRKRVCCRRPSGQIHCHPYQPCPPNSPN